VLIFPIVVDAARNPLRTFRRLAFGVMLVSCIPNLIAAFARDAGVDWGMLALMTMHVVAWAVTTTMLTRLTVRAV
jgi:Fe2+ transport system protein B